MTKFLFPFVLATITGSDHRDYAIPDITKSALVVNLPPNVVNLPPNVVNLPPNVVNLPPTSVNMPPPDYNALYAAADIVNVHGGSVASLQGGFLYI